MITLEALKHATIFRGVVHMPVNVCCHCAAEDDPEARWAEDEEGDRICLECAEGLDERRVA